MGATQEGPSRGIGGVAGGIIRSPARAFVLIFLLSLLIRAVPLVSWADNRRWFTQNMLNPWIRKMEAEFTRTVFGASRTHRLEIDLSGLMRGDPAQRWAAWEIAIRNNILTADEVRQEEGWNPKPVQKV